MPSSSSFATLGLCAAALAFSLSAARPAAATVLFSDSFQGDLSQWSNPASAAEIVSIDGGYALTFTELQAGFSLLTTYSGFTSSTGSFTLSFQLLTDCGYTNGCGAIFGSGGPNLPNWIIGDNGGPVSFSDSPAWTTISYTFAGTSLSNLTTEDWSGASNPQAYPGTGAIYIRDLTLTDDPTGIPDGTVTQTSINAPEPATLAIFAVGLFGLAEVRLRDRRGADARATLS